MAWKESYEGGRVLSLIPKENFPNDTTAILFLCFFVIGFLVELRIFKKQRLIVGQEKDKGSLPLLLLISLINVAIIFLLANYRLGQINSLFSYFGLGIMISGFFLRQWSIQTLKQFFTPVVSIQKNHRLITNGPYTYIRHPSCTGLLLEFLGASLATANIVSFFIVIAITIPSLLYRISIEEKVLIENFRGIYLSYKKKTKKLIPFVQ